MRDLLYTYYDDEVEDADQVKECLDILDDGLEIDESHVPRMNFEKLKTERMYFFSSEFG